MQNENLLKYRTIIYIWLQLRNNGGLFGGVRFLNFFVNLINFHFEQASMMIKVDNKVIDSLKRLYLNEYYIQ